MFDTDLKSLEWEPEREWRLFGTTTSVEATNASNIVLKIKPSEIYLGRKISPIHEKVLRDIAAEKGIPVFKMFIDDDSSEYNLSYKQLT